MTLTLRIEDGSVEYENLQKVKEVFTESSATKAIFAALAYATEKEERYMQMIKLADKARDEHAWVERILSKIQIYFSTEEWLKEESLKL